MDSVSYCDNLPLGGFNYDNCIRNKALLANAKTKGAAGQLKTAKTGTTICGIIFAVSTSYPSCKISLNNCGMFCFCRMASLWLLILELLEAALSETKTVRKSITLLQISDAVELEPLLIATM